MSVRIKIQKRMNRRTNERGGAGLAGEPGEATAEGQKKQSIFRARWFWILFICTALLIILSLCFPAKGFWQLPTRRASLPLPWNCATCDTSSPSLKSKT
jgi:hypothetical protein